MIHDPALYISHAELLDTISNRLERLRQHSHVIGIIPVEDIARAYNKLANVAHFSNKAEEDEDAVERGSIIRTPVGLGSNIFEVTWLRENFGSLIRARSDNMYANAIVEIGKELLDEVLKPEPGKQPLNLYNGDGQISQSKTNLDDAIVWSDSKFNTLKNRIENWEQIKELQKEIDNLEGPRAIWNGLGLVSGITTTVAFGASSGEYRTQATIIASAAIILTAAFVGLSCAYRANAKSAERQIDVLGGAPKP